jgi:hypothetical protein
VFIRVIRVPPYLRTRMLSATIQNAYNLFSRYQPTGTLDICTACCMKPEDERLLAALPVSDIPRDLLSEYNDGARTEKTELEEVKHFLPRYLELISQFNFPSHSTELSLSRLFRYYPSEWTKEESALLHRFMNEFFDHCLSTYPLPANDEIDSILIMFWAAHLDIQPLLDKWETSGSTTALLHFRDLHFNGFSQYNPTKLGNAFGDRNLADIIRAWLASEKVKQHFAARIEQVIIKNEPLEEGDLDELNLLYDMLRPSAPGT